MRQGKETYNQKYEDTIRLHKNGRTSSEIAKELNISYSSVYHWIKGLRNAPKQSMLAKFESFLKEKGPHSVADIKNLFPKHNELYNQAIARKCQIRRFMLSQPRIFGDSATWYYTPGQEAELKKRILQFLATFNNVDIKQISEELSTIMSKIGFELKIKP
jgi:predicted DNA-binding protein YlxM (UPF0122 family)